MLTHKSIHELRAIADSLNIIDLFSLTKEDLIEEIKKKSIIKKPDPAPEVEYVLPELNKPPSSRRAEIRHILTPYTNIGLHLSFDDGTWHMKYGLKEDSGHMTSLDRVIIAAAKKMIYE